MTKNVLTALTALGFAVAGIGVASAQNMGQQTGYTLKNGNAAALTTTTTSSSQFRGPVFSGTVPNPFDGTQSWEQWDKDHPMVGGDN